MAQQEPNEPQSGDQLEKDKYELLKEELGYDDEDIRTLAKSVRFKALGALGSVKTRKLTYLMREREKRDENSVTYLGGVIKRRINSGDSPPECKAKYKEIKNDPEFHELLSVITYQQLDGLIRAMRVLAHFNKGISELPELVSIFAEQRYRIQRGEGGYTLGPYRYDSLFDYEFICDGNYQMFKQLITIFKANPGRENVLQALTDASYLFRGDPRKTTIFFDLAKQCGVVESGPSAVKALEAAATIYNDDISIMEEVADFIKDVSLDCNDYETLHVEAFNQEEYCLRGSFEIFQYLLRFNQEFGEKAIILSAAHEIYGDDVNKMERVADIIKDIDRNLFGFGFCDDLTSAKSLYGDNIEIFQYVIEYVNNHGHEGLSDLLHVSGACAGDFERIKLAAQYLDNKEFPRSREAAKAYIDTSERGPDGTVEADMNKVGLAYANDVMQSEDCYRKIVDAAKYPSFYEFLPDYLQEFYGILGQTNLTALSSKLEEHFEVFNWEKGNEDQKKRVLKIYGDFLQEFIGTRVPVVWHLYCLLSDPENASQYLINFAELNNIREIEEIAQLSDLQAKIHNLKEGILLGDLEMDRYKESDLALAVLDDMAKVSASDWKRANRPLSTIVEEYERDEDDIQEHFDGSVYRSGFIPVREITEPLERDPALTENVARVQRSIQRFFKNGTLLEEKEALKVMQDALVVKIEEAREKVNKALKTGLNAKGEKLNDKAMGFARKSVQNLDSLLEEASLVESLEGLAQLLLGKKSQGVDCESDVRAIFYYLGASKQNLARPESWVNTDPTLVEASKLGEFLNDTILLEVVQGKSNEEGPDVKLSKPQRKTLKRQFIGLLNFLNQKQEEEKAHKEKVASSTKYIAAVAGRGLLAELSGFYCDACWTSKENILRDNPTMVGHTLVENFEEKEKSKIIGGCLTLESSIRVTDEESDKENNAKVMVVRGLNPQNASIKKFAIENFVENFLDYVQEAGRKSGAEYIILPLHNKGALSNRPEINAYLDQKYGKAERVSLNDDIQFNGYEIKDSCVVVRVVKENARKGKLPKPSNVPIERQDQWIGSW